MKKRGISPLIAVVLLVGIAVVLASVTLGWWRGQLEEGLGDAEVTMSGMNCASNQIDLSNANDGSTVLEFDVESIQGEIEGVYVRVIGTTGSHNEAVIKPIFEGGKTRISVPVSVGTIQTADVFPIINVDGKQKYCDNFIKKIDFT